MRRESFSQFFRVILKTIAEQHGKSEFKLSEDPEKLHWAFYEIAQKYHDEFPVLKELHFITAGAYPYSPELTEALDLLQMSGAISRQNPSYEHFSVTHYDDTDDVLKQQRARLVGNVEARNNAFNAIVSSLDTTLAA